MNKKIITGFLLLTLASVFYHLKLEERYKESLKEKKIEINQEEQKFDKEVLKPNFLKQIKEGTNKFPVTEIKFNK